MSTLHCRLAVHATAVAALAACLGTAVIAGAHEGPPPLRTSADVAHRETLAEEAPFLAENDAAMTQMMNDMAVKPTGDVDRDFVAMMVPHHQGAVDMAVAVLRHGHNEQLRRLAQEIIVTQQQEIAAMRLAIGDPLPLSSAAPTQPAPATR
jgi:hypothetical protein